MQFSQTVCFDALYACLLNAHRDYAIEILLVIEIFNNDIRLNKQIWIASLLRNASIQKWQIKTNELISVWI